MHTPGLLRQTRTSDNWRGHTHTPWSLLGELLGVRVLNSSAWVLNPAQPFKLTSGVRSASPCFSVFIGQLDIVEASWHHA